MSKDANIFTTRGEAETSPSSPTPVVYPNFHEVSRSTRPPRMDLSGPATPIGPPKLQLRPPSPERYLGTYNEPEVHLASKSKFIVDTDKVEFGEPSSYCDPVKDGDALTFGSRTGTLRWRIQHFIYHHLFKKIYFYSLFQLPWKYSVRMAEVFEEANLDLEELETVALESASRNLWRHHHHHDQHQHSWQYQSLPTPVRSVLPPKMHEFKHTWESCIRGFLKDWETLNLICVLLLSAILTILQIGDANSDLVTRYFALSSLMCALISLVYGSSYIVWFARMGQLRKAAAWAQEVQKDDIDLLWNVWVMMALPAVYLIWSLVLFICCIMAFTWRARGLTNGDSSPPPPQPSSIRADTILRGMVSGILGLGCVHGVLIVRTFKRYGDGHSSDKDWRKRVRQWVDEKYRELEGPLWKGSQPVKSATAPAGPVPMERKHRSHSSWHELEERPRTDLSKDEIAKGATEMVVGSPYPDNRSSFQGQASHISRASSPETVKTPYLMTGSTDQDTVGLVHTSVGLGASPSSLNPFSVPVTAMSEAIPALEYENTEMRDCSSFISLNSSSDSRSHSPCQCHHG